MLLFLAGFALAQNRVYELRTYTCNEGKLEALKARFRDHTIEIFKRHGMESIGYWVPQDPEQSKTTLIYILAHPSREAAAKNWAEFRTDPEWKKVASRIGGQRQDPRQTAGIGLHGPDRFLQVEITWTSRARRTCAILVEQLQKLEARLREGGGAARIERQHRAGKMTARERIAALLDPGAVFLEIGLLIAYDRYDGQAPAAGVVTGLGKIEGRPAVIVANDATVKAGAWWPETITKILRAQEIAMRNRLPIVYLVDSAGVNLPYQDGIFPGQYGAGRIFYYNSLMRRKLRIPQIAAVMGPCIAGGAYLPALSDVIIMVEGTSFMGLGGPNLVKGATGQVIDSEPLGGARLHTAVSGVAHYMAKDDADCLDAHPRSDSASCRRRARRARGRTPPARDAARSVRRAARRPPPALRHRGGDLPHLRRRRLPRVSAGIRARDAVRRRAAGRPSGGDRSPTAADF